MVIQNGKILLQKGYGYADITNEIPISPDTAFDLASVSKQFTAMAILILMERGKLNLDDSITKFIVGFPPYAKEITIRHLLNHTSGLPDYAQLFSKTGLVSNDYPRSSKGPFGGWEPTTRDTLKLLAQQEHLISKPGSVWSYSDSGYVVLAEIIERASGMKYGDFLKKNIFDPLGMKETVVYDERKPRIPNRAISYASWLVLYHEIDYTPLNFIYGDGNVNSTIRDLYRWDQALYTEKLIRHETMDQAFTPGTLSDHSAIPYGFGWRLDTYGSDKYLWHSGSWLGFGSMIARIPEQRFTVILLVNCSCLEVESSVSRILDIYLGAGK